MTLIYLVNVGANTTHQGKARSPILEDGRWHFVSFPTAADEPSQPYPETVRRYLRSKDINTTHADPCWEHHTDGNDCVNPRATALKTVKQGDMLLFSGGSCGDTAATTGTASLESVAGISWGCCVCRRLLDPGSRFSRSVSPTGSAHDAMPISSRIASGCRRIMLFFLVRRRYRRGLNALLIWR